MPRVEISVSTTSRAGLNSAAMMVAANHTDGMLVDNSGQKNVIYIKNASGVSINATFITTTVIDGIALPDLVIAIAAGAERMIGPFNNRFYGSGTLTKDIYIDFSASADVTVGAFTLGSV